MDVILVGLGVWCLISIPSALVIARVCALNSKPKCETVNVEPITKTPIPREQSLRSV